MYNAARTYFESLAKVIEKIGYQIEIIDINFYSNNKNFLIDLKENLKKNNVKYVIGHNGIAIRSLKEYFDIDSEIENTTFISLYGDHPIYQWNRHKKQLDNERAVFTDRSHVEFSEEVFNNKGTFVPPGKDLFTPKDIDKNLDLIFVGSIANPQKYRDKWLKMGEKLGEIYDELAEYALSKEFLELKKDVDFILNEKGINLKQEKKEFIYQKAVYVDKFVRYKRRIKVVNLLKNFDMDVYGAGWEKFITGSYNCNICGAKNFKEMFEEIREAKILVNVMPEFPHGGHERVLNSMGLGTAVATNANSYLKENFNDEEDIIYYSWKNMQKLPYKLNRLLANDKKLEQITLSGKNKIEQSHTLEDRIKLYLGE